MQLQYRNKETKIKTFCGFAMALVVSIVVIADDHMPGPCQENMAASCFATQWLNPTQETIDNCTNYTVCPSSVACLPVTGSGQNAGPTPTDQYVACFDYTGGSKVNGVCVGGASSGTASSKKVLVSVSRCQGSCVGIGCVPD
ncbi:MAG: hypothetical protein JNM86_10385 [Phycisphaerae bacterium]|nr:hypothetical protein [Phycisphaerae bacterium]